MNHYINYIVINYILILLYTHRLRSHHQPNQTTLYHVVMAPTPVSITPALHVSYVSHAVSRVPRTSRMSLAAAQLMCRMSHMLSMCMFTHALATRLCLCACSRALATRLRRLPCACSSASVTCVSCCTLCHVFHMMRTTAISGDIYSL
jgi:hypothetical protein